VAKYPRPKEIRRGICGVAEGRRRRQGRQPTRAQETRRAGRTGQSNRPANLYNGMISPLLPYAFKGAIGIRVNRTPAAPTSTAACSDDDQRLARGVGGKKFSFYFVQLANFMDQKPNRATRHGRNARSADHDPRVAEHGMRSCGHRRRQEHPSEEQARLGKRLALNAEAKVYKKKLEYSGPMDKSLKVKGTPPL